MRAEGSTPYINISILQSVQGRGQDITFGGFEPRSWRALEREPIGVCSGNGAPTQKKILAKFEWGHPTGAPNVWGRPNPHLFGAPVG